MVKPTLLLLTAALILGCAPANPIVGTWKMEFNSKEMNASRPGTQPPEISFKFNSNGTWESTSKLATMVDTLGGTYTLKDNEVTLNIARSNETKITNQTMRAVLSDDKKSLTLPDAAGIGKLVKQ